MEIIPVLDLMGGQVVHGVEGKRESYKPVRSRLLKDEVADPHSLMHSFLEHLNMESVYIADLDAIESNGSSYSTIARLKETFPKCTFMVDAGFRDIESVKKYLETGIEKVVVATETLESMDLIDHIARIESGRIVLGIDFKNGRFLLDFPDNKTRSPIQFIDSVMNKGFEEFILLDVGRVGSKRGIAPDLIDIRRQFPQAKWITGGGVKDYSDALQIKRAGFDGLLLATALHNGSIGKEEAARLHREEDEA